ncbi:hypothetical protein H8F22_11580 [Pseudomonas sp. P154a]|uniref:hypothetical protein n=1 Tax=Pseudomonas mucoides TaxID=2730424 RepID=UPI0018926F0D|nr:hypothetical protein [Pseudomonas mucoides]MBF6039511.1 hypothetical protein [Pseudomonas mucoides]
MNLNIVNTPDRLEVQGQVVSREYAEGVMLAGLFAMAGKNDIKVTEIVRQYRDAGLSTTAFPVETRRALMVLAKEDQQEATRVAEATWFAERAKEQVPPTPLEAARKRAERDAQSERIRRMGQETRAARGGGAWSSFPDFD